MHLLQSRADAPALRARSSRFVIRATADLQSLMRIANIFAQRDILPILLTARPEGDRLIVVVELTDGDAVVARPMMDRLSAMVCIDQVEWVEE